MTEMKIVLLRQMIKLSNYQNRITKDKIVIEKRSRSFIRRKRRGDNKRNSNVPEMTKVISFMIEQAH